MTAPLSGRGRGVLLLVVALLLTSCGASSQPSPQPVPGDRLPSMVASPDTTPIVRGRVWGARDQRLVPVFAQLSGVGAEPRLRALLALSDPGQQAPTAIHPRTRLVSMAQEGSLVEVSLSAEMRQVPQKDLPLALGQLVLTATEAPGVTRVRVLADGEPVRLVDADGQQVTRPLQRADFAGLVQDGE